MSDQHNNNNKALVEVELVFPLVSLDHSTRQVQETRRRAPICWASSVQGRIRWRNEEMGGEWLGQQRLRTATSHSELSTAWYFRKASEKVVNGRDQLKKNCIIHILVLKKWVFRWMGPVKCSDTYNTWGQFCFIRCTMEWQLFLEIPNWIHKLGLHICFL